MGEDKATCTLDAGHLYCRWSLIHWARLMIKLQPVLCVEPSYTTHMVGRSLQIIANIRSASFDRGKVKAMICLCLVPAISLI